MLLEILFTHVTMITMSLVMLLKAIIGETVQVVTVVVEALHQVQVAVHVSDLAVIHLIGEDVAIRQRISRTVVGDMLLHMTFVDLLHHVGLAGGKGRLHALQTQRMEQSQAYKASLLIVIKVNQDNRLGNQFNTILAVETLANVRGALHQPLVLSKLDFGDPWRRQ
jgi:hypothetical protein